MFAITIRERSGQVYTFHFDKPEVLIGRVKGNDVILPKQNISKRHTLVRSQGTRFVVEDLGSTNGTYVNGHRIATAVEIGPDDKVYLGDFVMTFMDLSEAGGAPPEVPAFDQGARAGDPESGVNVRSTQHMTNSPEPSADLDLLGGGDTFPAAVGADLASDLPPVEPLDMPQELVESGPIPSLADLGYEDRLTGPLDGLGLALPDLAPAPAPTPSSNLAAIPGLAAALKPPAKAPSVPDFSAVVPDIAAESTISLAEARTQVAEQVAAAKSAPSPLPTFEFGHQTAVEAPAPAAAPEGHYDHLAILFRNASRDLRASLPSDASQMSDSDWAETEDRVSAFVDQAARKGDVPADADVVALRQDLFFELVGLGPLEPMLDDPAVEAVEVNGPTQLYVVRDGRREVSPQRFSCQQALILAVDRLVRATGQTGRTGAQTDGTLPDGTSLFVVWPPICPAGPAVVLRKPRSESPDLETLVARGTVAPEAAEVLAKLLGVRRSVAIVGPSGVGKRTVLNALGQIIDPMSRLVVVEDGQRLRLRQEQVVRVDAAVMGDGASSPLKVAHRLRPDWLLIGDTAAMTLDELFSVTADGLPPWLAVFGARDAQDFIERVNHAILMRYPGLSESVAEARTLRGLDAVAVFVPDGHGGGSLSEVYEVIRHGGPGGQKLVRLTAESVRTR